MRIQILDDDSGWLVELALADQLRDALRRQMVLCSDRRLDDAFRLRLTDTLGAALTNALDYELRPPSEAQIAFATAIARELGVNLPADALRYRGPMHQFLDEHAELFRQRRAKPIATEATNQAPTPDNREPSSCLLAERK